MQNFIPNPCIRCGKERIVLKEWTEKVGMGGGIITHIETICPDRECQKIIDDGILAQREKRAAIELKRTQEKEERAKLLAAKN